MINVANIQKVWAIIGRIEAQKAWVAAMEAANDDRRRRGESQAYNHELFAEASRMLDELVRELEAIKI